MLAVYCNCESNGSDRLRKGRLLAPLFFSHHSPLSELDAGNRGTSYAKSGKGDLPEAKPAHQGEIPLNHEGNTRNNGIKFLQLLRQGQCREDYAGQESRGSPRHPEMENEVEQMKTKKRHFPIHLFCPRLQPLGSLVIRQLEPLSSNCVSNKPFPGFFFQLLTLTENPSTPLKRTPYDQ